MENHRDRMGSHRGISLTSSLARVNQTKAQKTLQHSLRNHAESSSKPLRLCRAHRDCLLIDETAQSFTRPCPVPWARVDPLLTSCWLPDLLFTSPTQLHSNLHAAGPTLLPHSLFHSSTFHNPISPEKRVFLVFYRSDFHKITANLLILFSSTNATKNSPDSWSELPSPTTTLRRLLGHFPAISNQHF